MLQFKIQQLAFGLPNKPGSEQELKVLRFLRECGLTNWVEDRVVATGHVFAETGSNTALLRFNYSAFDGNELELLQYQKGDNWLCRRVLPTVSHIGMHCEERDLLQWRKLMADHGIRLAQEVWTDSHTNPRIKNCRRYHYVIYETSPLIGVDMKFIVRSIIDEDEEAKQAAKTPVVARDPKDEALRVALEALHHHTQETHPIQDTDVAIDTVRVALGFPRLFPQLDLDQPGADRGMDSGDLMAAMLRDRTGS